MNRVQIDSVPVPDNLHVLSGRASVLLAVVIFFFMVMIGRMVQLQYIEHPELEEANRDQQITKIRWSPWRGSILDSEGRQLAVSVRVFSCALDPLFLETEGVGLDESIKLVDECLKLTPAEMQRIRERAGREILMASGETSKSRFEWVRRHLSDSMVDSLRKAIDNRNRALAVIEKDTGVKQRRVRGIILKPEYKRHYPHGQLAAHVLGFTNVDGVGQEAIERKADAILRGGDDVLVLKRDARGRKMTASSEFPGESRRRGLNVELSVDLAVQQITEEELAKIVEQYSPVSACSIVMNPFTGDVLALANYPTFDPNHPADYPARNRLNISVGSALEPGSTFKPFVFGRALETGKIKLKTPFNCENGTWRMPCGRVLHDVHGYGWLNADMVIVKSSNIGIAKIAALIGQNDLYQTMRRFGFGSRTGVPLQGEVGGKVYPLSRWTSYSMGSIPMGHEMTVTPIQLATAYCAIANGGMLLKPRIVKAVRDSDGDLVESFPVQVVNHRALSPEIAARVRAVLRKVVTDGTGKRLQASDYHISGKTGTAELAVNAEEIAAGLRGYSPNRYAANFVGIAPYDVPKIVVLTIVREPKGAYYGGTVAGPSVREISRRSLMYLGEPPLDMNVAAR